MHIALSFAHALTLLQSSLCFHQVCSGCVPVVKTRVWNVAANAVMPMLIMQTALPTRTRAINERNAVPKLLLFCMLHILTDDPIYRPFSMRVFHLFEIYTWCISLLRSRIAAVTMAGAVIAIDDATEADSILSVKQRVFAANRTLFVRRQRLVYDSGPFGMDALPDDETLGGAGVAHDGSAMLDVLLADLTEADAAELGALVFLLLPTRFDIVS
jgi:hypothetical protein